MSRIMAFAALALLASVTTAAAGEPLVLQLHGPAQFEFAGYYAALWHGFYKQAGLDVEIRPGAGRGQPATDPVRELTEGRAQFATGGSELVIRAGQGLPLLLLAPIFQQSGAAVYYRGDADFGSPAALVKGKLARRPATDILEIELATALRAEGIDPAKLKTVPIEPGQVVGGLADRTIDAAIGSAWDLPWLAREKGVTLKSFNPADYRVEFYGDMLFTLQRLGKIQPDMVRRFRAASLEGWEYALQHPDEVAGNIIKNVPAPAGISDPSGFAAYQADLARRLAHYPEVPLGHSNLDRWKRIEASLIGAGALLRTADTDDFVYDPDADARRRTDLRAFAILGGTLIGAVLVIVLLWLRWGLRPRRRDVTVARRSAASARSAAASVHSAPEPVTTDLNMMLNRLQRAIRRRIPRAAGFRLSLLPELWPCRIDLQIMRGMLRDLVDEASRQLKSGGELVVGTRNYAFDEASLAATPGAEIGEFVRLTVRDSGAGLSEAALAEVFDPTATRRPAVATAAATICRLGGFARVESAEGVGTAVHLYFPRRADTPAATVKAEKEPAAAE